jgi:hypothetical protein
VRRKDLPAKPLGGSRSDLRSKNGTAVDENLLPYLTGYEIDHRYPDHKLQIFITVISFYPGR